MRFEIGTKVIARTNEDEPYGIGNIEGYTYFGAAEYPKVKLDNGKVVIHFGIVMPYSAELAARLDKLNPKQQWELLWTIKENDKGKEFIIMRGCPGSGKSTLAKKLAGVQGQVFSTDDYFMDADSKYNWDKDKLGEAHRWNMRRSLAAINAKIPVIVIDNTNTTIREIKAYLEHIKLARQIGYTTRIVEPDTAWRFDVEELTKRNSHNVPKETIQKMVDRYVQNVLIEDILFD